MGEWIRTRGARTHNLKNINVDLPRNRFVVITGLSGSGKSSFAFDTLYAEGQRRYVESLSAYARQFLSMMEKPDVDVIEGLSPAISIEQKSATHNPRSTVGTVTEIYDYLRLLYARVGEPRCPDHDVVLAAKTVSQMVDAALKLPMGTRLTLLAPVVRHRKGDHAEWLAQLRLQGFLRVRVNGNIVDLEDMPVLDPHKKHDIDVVVDRVKVREDLFLRLVESFETALRLANGLLIVHCVNDTEEKSLLFSAHFACPHCGYSLEALEPSLFSFNNPKGACEDCNGLGVRRFFDPQRVVQDPHLSLKGGAVCGWDHKNTYHYHLLSSIAAHYGFDLEVPFASLSDAVQHIILWGSGKEKILLRYPGRRGRMVECKQVFEGIIPNMERCYQDTESEVVRDKLARYLAYDTCTTCQGARLSRGACHVYVGGKTLPSIVHWPLDTLFTFLNDLSLQGQQAEIAKQILKEIVTRLHFLISVGLNYLSLNRRAETLSGGEAQRIRLASQIGSGLVGVLYILDEPSIGLHQRDNQRLLDTLTHLRDLGNTVIVVEHDEDAIRQADHVLDIGPGAGIHGGQVVAQGTANEISQVTGSLTGDYLSGRRVIPLPEKRVPRNPKRILRLQGVTHHNLQNVNVDIPIGLMTCVTGVSGSGKSSLVNDTLYPIAARQLNGALMGVPARYKQVSGLGFLDKVVGIDQSPIGRTPRSNPATYTGLFTPIRELFAQTQEARSRGYTMGRFSFNVKGGRCEICQGGGMIRVEMHFLADVYVACDACEGKRYHPATLDILYKGKNIHEVLSMTVEEARDFFDAVPILQSKLQTLIEVGLSYISLGQSAITLSGGEAQRVKLAKELSKRATGNTLYILDEPTTGLHFHDVQQLLVVLQRLRDHGNTVVIIEHHLDVIKTADWMIDLGPEGGAQGGKLLVSGTPEQVAECKQSYTGQFLRPLLFPVA